MLQTEEKTLEGAQSLTGVNDFLKKPAIKKN